MEAAPHIFASLFIRSELQVELTLKRRGVRKGQGVPETMKPESRALEAVLEPLGLSLKPGFKTYSLPKTVLQDGCVLFNTCL